MTTSITPGWSWHRLASVHGAGAAVVASALALSVFVVVLVRSQAGGAAASVAATAMTMPVAFARRAPMPSAAFLAAAAAANEIFFGHLIRCGAALPAAFFVAYVAGNARAGRVRAPALAAVIISIVIQCVFDPQLGAGVIVLMAPLSAVFFGAGILVRRRSALVAELRRNTEQLRTQRERTAYLAVAAERARINADIRGTLRERINEIDVLTRAARTDSGDPGASFAAIECTGRAILDSMRLLVGTLRDAPTEPEPGLAELTDLLACATTADTRLSVEGSQRPLPASIELTGYRIVEQLLTVLRDDPSARIDVQVRFASDCLDLRITGPPANDEDLRHVRSLVQARLALYGGTIDFEDTAGQRAAQVRLPLVTSHA